MAIQIEYSLNAWSKALGLDEKTLASRLSKAGLPNGGQIPARDVVAALAGSKDATVIRLNTARAERLELENRVRDAELINIPSAERLFWQELLFPLKQELDMMAEKLAPLLTGDESERLTVLRDWWETVKSRFFKEQ